MTNIVNNKNQAVDDQVWYVHVSNQTRGPLSLRDLDVLLRTNQINSRTLGWKSGMPQWKVLNDIEQIKESILQSSKEILEITKKRQSLFDKHQSTIATKTQNNNDNQQKSQTVQDAIIENKDQDALTILQTTVKNLLKKTFHQSQDGKWNIYDQKKAQWVAQDEQPTQQIEQMTKDLFNKLKNQLFFDNKNNRRKNLNKNIQAKQDDNNQQPLSKQQLLKRQKNKKKTKRAAEKKKEKWYKSKINTFIYISGLPFDITQEELKEFASKAGVLRVDLNTGQEKIKIYKDQDGCAKGDAAISYAREQSVEIAIENLNNSEIRPGFPVRVERAQFNQKDSQYKPREIKKQSKISKIIAKKNEEKKLTWDQEVEQEGQGLKIVILKHFFTPQCLNNDQYINSAKADITYELGKIGQLQRIRFYEAHAEGVVEVKFKYDKDAQECIHIMNGRYYDGREIVCEYWDGQTDYKKGGVLDYERMARFGQQLQRLGQILQQNQQSSKKQQQQREQHTDNKAENNQKKEIIQENLQKN